MQLLRISIPTARWSAEARNSRQIPFALRKEVQEQVEEMLADHIIEESYSSYVNPLTLVQRDGKRVRICLDAREANKFMTPYRATVPPMQMLFIFIYFHSVYPLQG